METVWRELDSRVAGITTGSKMARGDALCKHRVHRQAVCRAAERGEKQTVASGRITSAGVEGGRCDIVFRNYCEEYVFLNDFVVVVLVATNSTLHHAHSLTTC